MSGGIDMKRICSVALALLMVLSILPMSVLATSPEISDFGFTVIGDDKSTLAPGVTTTAHQGSADTYTWVDNTDTVYIALGRVNLRSDTVINDSTYKATAYFGDSFQRIKVAGGDESGWSLINVNGAQYYVRNDCITTDSGSIIFTDMADTTVYVTAETSLNLRAWTDASNNDSIGATVFNGDELVQTGVGQNGRWARISYKGATLYCVTSYISTTAPSAATTASPITPPPAQG
jgi:hypothetical protein